MSCKGVVAAGHEATVGAAEIMLRDGGNAFDAVIAAFFAACVAEPALASLGGGGFLVACANASQPIVYDFFVQTPLRRRHRDELNFSPTIVDFGTAEQQFHIGEGTAATPGSVKGIFEIHRDLGSIPMQQIVEPAVRYAREGIEVNATQAYVLSILSSIYMATPQTREVYRSKTASNSIIREGEVFLQPQLADTIESLATEGEALFYRGEIAAKIAKQCLEDGGQLTHEDLEGYRVTKRHPLETVYAGSRVITNPPPSSGGVLIAFGLQMLEALNLGTGEFGSYRHLRLLAEVMDLTHEVRMNALNGDSNGSSPDDCVLDSNLLERYRTEINQRVEALRGTTQISVIDSRGNVASMTVSNGEGCGSMVANAGFMLNNMLGEHDLNARGFHLWDANQRMSSMMAPSVIRRQDGKTIATGSGGSNRIRTALLQVIFNLVHFNMGVTEAVGSPRIHLEDEKLSVEGGFSSASVNALIADFRRREVWTTLNLFFGGAHTVMAGDGQYVGIGDPRRGGVCAKIG